MIPAAFTPDVQSADPLTRFVALAAETRAKLELALDLTDMLTTVSVARSFLTRLACAEANIVRAGKCGADVAYAALGTWGRNGRGPAIDGVLSSARFHGRNWRAQFDAARADSRRAA